MVQGNSYYASGEKLKTKNILATKVGIDFPEWALSHLNLDEIFDVLDAGCGWGRFALALGNRAPHLQMTCMDIWPDMVETCRQTLDTAQIPATFCTGDVHTLPFRDLQFDLVITAHMLYMLDPVEPVIAELARVLRPEGYLLATTYSDTTRVPLIDFHYASLQTLGIIRPTEPPSSFSLDNGANILASTFHQIDTKILEERTVIADVDRFVEIYTNTGRYHDIANDVTIPAEIRAQLAEAFREQVMKELSAHGTIEYMALWTAFIAK